MVAGSRRRTWDRNQLRQQEGSKQDSPQYQRIQETRGEFNMNQ